MKIYSLSPLDVLRIKQGMNNPPHTPEYSLLCDSFFKIGFAQAQNGKIKKQLYTPLEMKEPFKNSFSLIEILPSMDNSYFVRCRYNNQVEGAMIRQHDLNFHLQKFNKFYLTLSIEDALWDHSFENTFPGGFSLLHYFYEGVSKKQKSLNMAIVADPGSELPAAYHEGAELFAFLRKELPRFPVTLFSSPLSGQEFDNILSRFSLVHFCGHIEDRGIWLGKDFYHPAFSFQPLPGLLYLNGCELPFSLFQSLVRRKIQNLVYHRKKVEDSFENPDTLKYFYLGVLCGYRIGDVARATLNFQQSRLYGWMTNRFPL
jgi:hypothetical protein